MNLAAHMANLETKHSNLEARIAQEIQRPAPDNVRISQLKKEKLQIKEELSRLTTH